MVRISLFDGFPMTWWFSYDLASQCTLFPKAIIIHHWFRLDWGYSILVELPYRFVNSYWRHGWQGSCSCLSSNLVVNIFLRRGKWYYWYTPGCSREPLLWCTLSLFCYLIAVNLQNLQLNGLKVRQTWFQIYIQQFTRFVTLYNWLNLLFFFFSCENIKIIVFT